MKELVDQIQNRIVVDNDHFSNKINYYILNSLSYSVYDQQIENLWEKFIFDNEKINLFTQDKAKAKILCILANKTSKFFNIIIPYDLIEYDDKASKLFEYLFQNMMKEYNLIIVFANITKGLVNIKPYLYIIII